MAQVINDPWRSLASGYGQTIGAGLGQGLGQGISQLAQQKLGQVLQQRQQAAQTSRLQGALQQAGLNPQMASLIGQFRPEDQFKVMQTLGPMMQGQQQPEQQMTQQVQQAPLEQMGMNNDQLSQLLKPYNPMDNAVAQKLQPNMQKQPIPTQKPLVKEPISQKPIKATQPSTFGLTPAQRIQEKKLAMQEKVAQEKQATVEQHRIDKQVTPYIDMLNKKGGPVADSSDMVLNRMEKLIDSDKLTGSMMYNFRKKMEHAGGIVGGGIGTAIGAGIGLGLAGPGGAIGGATVGGGLGAAAGEALMPKFVGSKEDQEFTKLSLGFMDKLKDIFGGRIAIQEMQMYMDSIPTLAMTDEGKKQVINDMRLISQGWKHKKAIKDKIVAENNDKYPADIEQRVEEISKPFMDRLSKKFVDGMGLSAA